MRASAADAGAERRSSRALAAASRRRSRCDRSHCDRKAPCAAARISAVSSTAFRKARTITKGVLAVRVARVKRGGSMGRSSNRSRVAISASCSSRSHIDTLLLVCTHFSVLIERVSECRRTERRDRRFRGYDRDGARDAVACDESRKQRGCAAASRCSRPMGRSIKPRVGSQFLGEAGISGHDRRGDRRPDALISFLLSGAR